MIAVFVLSFIFIQGVLLEETGSLNNIDINEVLKNERLLKNYLDCLLEKIKCTADGQDLKKNIPDALQNGCAKCTDKHRQDVRKVISHLIKNKPEWWKALQAKYDPTGEYAKKYHFKAEE